MESRDGRRQKQKAPKSEIWNYVSAHDLDCTFASFSPSLGMQRRSQKVLNV